MGRPSLSDVARRASAIARYNKYAKTPKGKYTRHKANAKRRGVAFEMTFAQWWGVWQRSGKWDERGNAHGAEYVMCRKGDLGAYAVGNVYIGTHAANTVERNAIYSRPSFVGAAARLRQQQRNREQREAELAAGLGDVPF